MTKVVFAPKAGFTVIPPVKAMINIGACLDIPVGTYIKGKRGENILNGGLGSLTGVVGIGNNFKTTIALYMMFVAMARILNSSANEYDTEINVHEWHVRELLLAIKEFFNEDIIDSGRFEITDKTIQFGGAWWDKLKGFLQEKIKNNKQLEVFTPFINREKTDFLKIIIPTFTLVDSLSEFITEDVVKMQDANLLGDSGANTVQMRQGLLKEQDIEICPVMEGVELLLVDGKEIGRYLLITYVGWIANNDVERTDVSNQEIRLTDITVKRKGGSNFRYPAAARGDLRLIYIVCKHIALKR